MITDDIKDQLIEQSGKWLSDGYSRQTADQLAAEYIAGKYPMITVDECLEVLKNVQ